MTIHCDIRALFGQAGRILLAACVALGLPYMATAQLEAGADEVEEAEEIRRYTVEMIVFEYAQSALAGNEQFLPDEPLPEEELEPIPPRTFGDPGTFVEPDVPVAIDDTEISQDEALEFLLPDEPEEEQELEELPSHILQTQLEVLDPEEHAMQEIYEKLVELDAYRPLMRAAWTQATFEKEQTLPIRLRRLGNAPLRLDGTVMLYLSRYLHFVVDLTIEAREERTKNPYDEDTRYYGDRWSSTRYDFGYEQQPALIKYTISEDRIFRNGELRYYDHPKFGVLVRVTRIEEEEPETDEMFLLPPETEVSGGG